MVKNLRESLQSLTQLFQLEEDHAQQMQNITGDRKLAKAYKELEERFKIYLENVCHKILEMAAQTKIDRPKTDQDKEKYCPSI